MPEPAGWHRGLISAESGERGGDPAAPGSEAACVRRRVWALPGNPPCGEESGLLWAEWAASEQALGRSLSGSCLRMPTARSVIYLMFFFKSTILINLNRPSLEGSSVSPA